jgi:hypothetical protein
MKKYLEIYVGSRGLIEGIAEMEFDNIEDYLQKEMNSNLEGMDWDEDEDEDYIEEMEGYWDWEKIDNGYYLGLGDEEVKYYIDMESEKFKDWLKKELLNDELYGETFWNWNDLANEVVYDILDKVLGY